MKPISVKIFAILCIALILSPQRISADDDKEALLKLGMKMGGALAAGLGAIGYIGFQWVSKKFENPSKAIPITHITNTITNSGGGTVHFINPFYPGAYGTPQQMAENFFESLTVTDYAKMTLLATGSAYLYLVYTIFRTQKYLNAPQRKSLWFYEIPLNTLLMLEPHAMQNLLIQEFITLYQVNDQKTLKDSIHAFIQDLEEELSCLTAYQGFINRLETVSQVTQKGATACGYALNYMIPLSGMVLPYLPSLDLSNIFFIDIPLKKSIQERISRIHYYKNIFLQSAIVI